MQGSVEDSVLSPDARIPKCFLALGNCQVLLVFAYSVPSVFSRCGVMRCVYSYQNCSRHYDKFMLYAAVKSEVRLPAEITASMHC